MLQHHQNSPLFVGLGPVYESISLIEFLGNGFYSYVSKKNKLHRLVFSQLKEIDKIALRRWRKRGFYSENVLVKLLQKNGFNAVRIPVSNPSLNPLPDIIGRKGEHSFAFEVKNATYYAYFPKQQINKLFRFLNEMVPTEKENKHAIVAAHLGKKWTFREVSWLDWEKDKLPEKVRILKRDRGNFGLDKSFS